MIYIDGLDLTDVVSFKKLSVDFVNPLTYIRGCNLDSDYVNPTGNGVGKTLLFSSIANVLYQATPLAYRKNSKKDILRNKNSEIGFILRPSETSPEYEIIQRSNDYQIFEDGKDLQIRTKPLAEAFISKLFPIKPIDFYSRCFISTQRPYLLQTDSDANRLKHLIDIFDLDQHTVIQKYFAKKSSDIHDYEIKLSVLQQKAIELNTKLKAAKSSISKEKYLEYKELYSSISKKIERLQTKRFETLSSIQALESLLTIEEELDSLRKQYPFSEPPSKVITVLKDKKSAVRRWETYDESSASILETRSKIEQKLKKLNLPSTSFKELRENFSKAELQLSKAINRKENLIIEQAKFDRLSEKISDLKTEYEELNVTPKLDKDYDSELSEAKSVLRLKAVLDSTEDHNDQCVCPTCFSKVDLDAIKSAIKSAKYKIDKLTSLQKAKELYLEAKVVNKQLSKLSDHSSEIKSLTVKIKKTKDLMDEIESELYVWKQYADLKSQLDHLGLPDKPTVKRPKESYAELDNLSTLCTDIEKHLNAKDKILKNHQDFLKLKSVKLVKEQLSKLSKELEKLDSEISSFGNDQSKISIKISEYEQYTNVVEVYKKELDSIDKEVKLIKPYVEDKKLVTILTKAYGPKGLRSDAAQNICSLLEKNLNHYRDIIFSEPFSFSLKASNTGLSILVDRNNGRSDSVSDVRHLSGAESESFSLLCCAALLPLIPDSKQLNMLILDEPTSHFHPVSRTIFNDKFIPFIKDIIPNIYVIDNQSEELPPNCSEWVVEKHKGVSTLIKNCE